MQLNKHHIKDFCVLIVLILLLFLFGFLVHGKSSLWMVLVLWGFGSAVVLYVPQLAAHFGRYNRETIVHAYFRGGGLLIFFGAVSAGFTKQYGELLVEKRTISGDTLDLIQVAMLAFTAVTGGALCTDAILGMELDGKVKRVTLREASTAGLIFSLLAFGAAIVLDHHEWRYDRALLWVGGFLLLCGVIFPVVAVWIASWSDDSTLGLRKPSVLLLVGVAGIFMAMFGAFTVPDQMDASGWTSGSREFMKQLLLTSSAAIGACLIARALETNKPQFQFSIWADIVVASAIDGARARTDGWTIAVQHKDSALANPITITVPAQIVSKLMRGSEIVRAEMARDASAYVRRVYEKDTRRADVATPLNYALKKELIKDY